MASVSSVIAASVISALASGCALAITAPDPERPRLEIPKCDTGKGLVIADGLWGTLFGVAALAALANDESGPGVALGGVSALAFASAVRGHKAADNCRAALDDYQAAVREDVTTREIAAARRARERVDHAQLPVRIAPQPPLAVKPIRATPPAAPTPAPPPRAKRPAPAASDDEWSAFWKELP